MVTLPIITRDWSDQTMSTGAPASARRGRLLRVVLVTASTLVILVGVFAYTSYGNGASASVTLEVRDAFTQHLSHFAAENTTLLMNDYGPNATLEWVGTTRGLGGTYNSTSLIGQFYSELFSKVTNVSVRNATYTVQVVGGSAAVNGTIELLGGGPQVQTLNGEVITNVAYVHINGEWVISNETWNFLALSLQRPLG